MNGLNKHLGADGIRLHVQCWLTHANIQHFINKAIKFAVTFRDDVDNNNNNNIIKIFLPYAGVLKPYTLKTPKNSDISFHLCAISYQVCSTI